MAGWRPSFGQVDAAQSHLANQGVGVGDLFLFFGWFREVELANGPLRYRADAPDLHCLFGWLQVGDVFHPAMDGSEPPAWAADHPHVRYSAYYGCETTNNTLYVASEKLRLPGLDRAIAGGGVFDHFAPRLQLTDTGQQRSTWRLPAAFYPTDGAPPLSYHSSMSRWTEAGDQVFLQLVARGQEFVLDCDFYPGVYAWLGEVFSEAPTAPVAPAD
jgi:hypothetical protein